MSSKGRPNEELIADAKAGNQDAQKRVFAQCTRYPVGINLADGSYRAGQLVSVQYRKKNGSLCYVHLQLETDAAGKQAGQHLRLHKHRIESIEFYDPGFWGRQLEGLLREYVGEELPPEETAFLVLRSESLL